MIDHRNDEQLPPVSDPGAEEGPACSDALPEIEGYEIIECLGEGGMGTVWRAMQLSTDRGVALKLLGTGAFASEKVRARFEREVELTARLHHRNVAQIYDSGLHRGVYYYAMELIDGAQLDDYVKEHALNQRQILELMQTVCEAVQHAHERGVIHRDLKPSNILVTADGEPHILDFGLAKTSLEGDLELKVSSDGDAPGTPAYMSPEQAAGHVDEIDTRTDVYSLGVILFRLLVGQPPLDVSGTRYEVLRRIAEEDVRRPRDLTRKVDGELEAILLKALAHDPKERYSSAGALAQDIENYLAGEPLLARQRSTLYFLRKRIWKHRLPVAIGCSVVAVLIGVAVFAYVRIAHERNKAVAAHDKAQNEADKANTVYEFLGDILSSVEPEKAHGREVTLREAVDQAAKDVSTKFANQPEVEAKIRTRIGDIYSALGQYREAEGQYFCALELRRDQLGGEHRETLLSMFDLAKALGEAGKLQESETMHRKLLEIRRRVLGNEHVDTLKSLVSLGATLEDTGKLDESERLLTQAVKLDERLLGEEHKLTLDAMDALASTLTERARLDEAEAMARRVLEIRRRVLGEEHPDTMDSVRSLARVLASRGEEDEAGAMYEMDLEFQRERLGDEHPDTLGAMSNWTWVLRDRGKLEEAEATAREVFEARRRLLGEEHPETLTAMNSLARTLQQRGGFREAETMLKRCIEIQQRVLGREHPDALRSMSHLARVLNREGRRGEAAAMQGRLLETAERVLGEEHSLTLDVMNSWAVTISSGKRWLDTMCGDVLRGRPPETVRAMHNMEDPIWEGDVKERVEALYRKCLDIRQRTLGPEHPSTLVSMCNLAIALRNGGELDEAEGLVRQHLEIQLRAFDEKFGDKEPPPVTSPTEAEFTHSNLLACDDFDGKPSLDWKILNPDPTHYSHSKNPGMLTITTQKGDFWNAFTDYRNLFVIDCPASEDEDFQVTTCLSSFKPVERWHQGGLILYNDDDEYLKFSYEPGRLVVGFERGSSYYDDGFYRAHASLERLWLRVTKRGNRYTFSTSLDGRRFIEERWSMGLSSDLSRGLEWGSGSVKQVGLYAMNGVESEAPEIDASFDFFEVRSVPGKTDSAEEETLAAASEREELGSTLWLMSDVGNALREKGELESAESIQKECLEMQRRVFGKEHRHTVRSLRRLSLVLDKQDRLDEMEKVEREVVEIRRRVQGKHHPDTLTAMDNLASLLIREGKHVEAAQVYGEALEVRGRVFGEDHPETLRAMHNIAKDLSEQGKFDEAEALVRQCLEIRLRAFDQKFGDKEPPTVPGPRIAEFTEGKVLAYDDFDGKLARDWNIRNPDPSHHSLTKTPGMLTITTQKGDLSTAVVDYKNLFLIDCPASKGEDFQLTTCLSSFNPVEEWHQAGLILYNDDDEYLRFVYDHGPWLTVGFETGGPRLHTRHFRAHSSLDRLWLRVTKRGNRYTFWTSLDGKRFVEERCCVFLGWGDFIRGFEWGDGSVKQIGLLAMNGVDSQAPETDASFDFFEVRSVPGKADAGEEEILAVAPERQELGWTLTEMSKLGGELLRNDALEKAEAILRECVAMQRRVFGNNHPDTLMSLEHLASVLDRQDKLDETERVQREVVGIRRHLQGEDHADTLRAMDNLASLLIRQGKQAEAEQVYGEALEVRGRVFGEDHPETLTAMQNFAKALSGEGKFDEAEAIVRQCLEIQLRAFDEKSGDEEPPPVTSPWEAMSTDGKVLAYEDFDGMPSLDWKILNPDPTHFSHSKNPGMLTITTQNGDFWNAFTDYKNLFLIDCPASEGEDFQVTTCLVSFNPVGEWHQAGLILYNDDDEYLKFTYEHGPIFTIGFETGRPRFERRHFRAHPSLDRLWLRVTKRGNRYAVSTSLDGKRFFEERWLFNTDGDLSRGLGWGNGSVKRVGLIAMNGVDSEAPEIDASFDFFEVRSVSDKTDAVEEEILAAAPEREELGSTLLMMSNLGERLGGKGELERAEAILRECIGMERLVFGREYPRSLMSLRRLSSILNRQSKLEEMEKVEKEVVEILRHLQGEQHADTLMTMDYVASLLGRQGKHAEAEQVYRETLEVLRRVLGEDHPRTLTAVQNVATALSLQGKFDEAEEMRGRYAGARRGVLVETNPAVLSDMRTSAFTLRQTGKFDEAEAMFRRLLQTRLLVQGGEAPDTLIAMKDVATTLFMAGKPDEAEATLRQAVTTSRAQEKEQPLTPELMMYLARLLEARGKEEEAEPLREESVEIRRRLRGEEAVDNETAPGAAEALGKSAIPTNLLKIPQELEACAANLQRIHAAIKQYEKDKGKLPAWLSNLVPDYLSSNLLICPNDPSHSSPLADPKIACSYGYEFSPLLIPNNWGPTPTTPFRDWKTGQVRLFGDVVPVAFCHHHGGMQLELSVGGEIYWNPSGSWEARFLPSYLPGDELSVQQASEQGEEKETKVQGEEIATSGNR